MAAFVSHSFANKGKVSGTYIGVVVGIAVMSCSAWRCIWRDVWILSEYKEKLLFFSPWYEF